MTERYDVPLDDLERGVRVAGAQQVEVQAECKAPYEGLLVITPPHVTGGGDADGD